LGASLSKIRSPATSRVRSPPSEIVDPLIVMSSTVRSPVNVAVVPVSPPVSVPPDSCKYLASDAVLS